MAKASSPSQESSKGGKSILDYSYQALTTLNYTHSVPSIAEIISEITLNSDTVTSVNIEGIEHYTSCGHSPFEAIAPAMQKLTHLKTLNMSKLHDLTTPYLKILTALLPHWTKLESINLKHTILFSNFEDDKEANSDLIISFAIALNDNCKLLRDFDISNTIIKPYDLSNLLGLLTELPSLSGANFSNICKTPAAIFYNFASFSNVKDLNLSYNGLNINDVKLLLRLIKSKPDITIDLSGNFIYREDGAEVFSKRGDDSLERALIPEAQLILDIAMERYLSHVNPMIGKCFSEGHVEFMIKMVTDYVGSIPALKIYSAVPALAVPASVEDASSSSASASSASSSSTSSSSASASSASSASACSVDVISDTLSLSMPLSASPPEVLGEHVSIADFHGF